jgi:hypothetical protein
VRDDPGRSCRDAALALAESSRVMVRASCRPLHDGVRMKDVSCSRLDPYRYRAACDVIGANRPHYASEV